MNNDELNNETDNLFRKGLENLSEKRPPEQEWQRMKSSLEKEGLVSGKKNTRRFFILLLLISIGAGTGSFYFLNKDSLPSNNASLKTDRTERIKNESSANKYRATTLEEPSQAKDSSKEIERKTTTEIKDEDKSTISTKEPAIAEHQKSETTIIESDNAKSNQLKNKTPTVIADKEQTMKRKTPASSPKEDKPSDVGESNEGSDGAVADKSSPAKKTSQGSNDSPSTDNRVEQQDTTQVAKNQNNFPATASNTEDRKGSDTSAVNNTNTPLLQDSSKISNDVVPVIEKKKNSGRSKFHIGGFFSLDFNHYLLKENSAVPANEVNYVYNSDSIKGINSGTQFTAGIMLAYMINDRFEIEGGASYSKKEEVKANVNTPAQTTDSMQQTYSEYIYNYNADYFELSGKVKYYYPIGSRKWLYAGIGGIVSFNFPENSNNLGYYTHITYSDSVWVRSDKVTLQPASATFSALVLAGFETELTNKWSVFIEPEYKYGFNPVIKHPTFDYIPVNHYWRTFSIAFGLKYSL